MAMPIDLVLVRHGEAEHNVASRFSKAGDHSLYTPEFRMRHNSEMRLSDKGIEQATNAGVWMRVNGFDSFDRYYVADYLRAVETAYYLDLQGAEWFENTYLHEREWGDLEGISHEDRGKLYADLMAKKAADSFHIRLPNGESMNDVCLRVDNVLGTLSRECGDQRVVIVCHGEVAWAFRVRIERMSQLRWRELDGSTDPVNSIYNCQILHYTRRNPNTGEISQYYDWLQMIRPDDPSFNHWIDVEAERAKSRFSNADLKKLFERVTRQIAG